MDLAVQLYRELQNLPDTEKYGLVTQMKRAVVSIPSNIAEGTARQHKKETVQFLYISLSSLSELETQLILSKTLGFINNIDDLMDMIKRVRMMLSRLIAHGKRF